MEAGSSIYNAEIVAGSLMLPESRRLAALLLARPTAAEWSQALKSENILQKKTPATARRHARLIRNRLEQLTEDGWRMIAEGDSEVALQMLLVAAVKHSRLLGDFMRDVLGHHIRSFQDALSRKDWDDFFTECMHRDVQVAGWSQTTRAKLHQVILRILRETGYIDSTRRPRLSRVFLHAEVKSYLARYSEKYARTCMDLYS